MPDESWSVQGIQTTDLATAGIISSFNESQTESVVAALIADPTTNVVVVVAEVAAG